MSVQEKTAQDSIGKISLSVTGMMRQFGNGEMADLRRMDDRPSAPAYWRLAARHSALSHYPKFWSRVVRALAILTPKGPPGERGNLHEEGRRFGTVLCDGGRRDWPSEVPKGHEPRPAFSERRLAQLLAARGAQRMALLTRAVRMIAAHRDSGTGVDVTDLARAFLEQNDPGLIAGPYYKRLDRAQFAAEKENSADD